MNLSEEAKKKILDKYKEVCDDDNFDLEEFLFLDLVVTAIKMEPLKELAIAGISDKQKLVASVEGLLKIIFDDDVSNENIRERFDVLKNDLDSLLLAGSSEVSPPHPIKDPAVCLHIQLAQRILVARLGSHMQMLSRRGTSFLLKMPYKHLIEFHNELLKLISYLRMLPHAVRLRLMPVITVDVNNLVVRPEEFLFKRDAGTGRIIVDLLQPKEMLMEAFERYVDSAKAKMRGDTSNEMAMNLYDFRRKKDGRLEKSIYRDWYKAIIEYEDSEGYSSSRQAAEAMAGVDEDPESVRRTIDNRIKRFNSLFKSVMANRFPSEGQP